MGQFDWFRSIGATPEAVAVLNDQPILFTILLIVLVAVILQGVLLWYIHFATLKPEQKKKKEPKKGDFAWPDVIQGPPTEFRFPAYPIIIIRLAVMAGWLER
ncbi:hypothetical protein HER10_EVM0003577 [Colletotrichum scovillei]|uniref:uncharacterized protein n=1 Tax=Colletotrichum scovillei TaxID=1209932 RepID=UPI0015C3A27D|nr:uncharacterized protein HER10_EVM0003577 [Colletotrichum scovillei]KAF4776101.1 hypothetical protein HER10_EVM0003577 [Colletotrichum scovillei]